MCRTNACSCRSLSPPFFLVRVVVHEFVTEYNVSLLYPGHQEVERLTLENSKLAEENQDLHRTVGALQEKNTEVEASLEEKTNYLLRLAEEVTAREEKILTNEQLLSSANQKVCLLMHIFRAVHNTVLCSFNVWVHCA